MKYFIDTEFLEGTQTKRWFSMPCWFLPNNQTKPTIDLISIGIVAEDGREYYAISKDFNLKEAWNRWQQRTGEGDRNNVEPRLYWISENVLRPIFDEFIEKEYELRNTQERILGYSKPFNRKFTYKNFKKLLEKYGKTNKQISEEIKEFVYDIKDWDGDPAVYEHKINHSKPEFYAYYADYDWVAFCWLFGKMINLPKGFPMYCIDLKQTLDKKANSFTSKELSNLVHPNCKHNVFELLGNPKFDLTHLGCLKSHPDYPKQTNEHNALADAKWNYELYKFLTKL